MDWFKLCKSEEEAKILYRELAKEYHPDLSNVDPEIMIEINNQYEIYLNKIKNPIPEQKEIVKEVKVKKEKFKIIFTEEQTESIKNHLVNGATIASNAIFSSLANHLAKKYIKH
jgi:hypothetical protein